MPKLFVWCAHCLKPHDPTLKICPETRRNIRPFRPEQDLHSLSGTMIADRYEIRSLIGKGGMAWVFAAFDRSLRRHVALKILKTARETNTHAALRMQREARLAGSIGHPNVCIVFDSGVLPNGAPFIVMERLFGATLAARLKKEKKVPLEEAIAILKDMLSALHVIHDAGIVHRDIKPRNIFLADLSADETQYVVKLLDFGLSKRVDGRRSVDTGLTAKGTLLGTLQYMSPEQMRRESVDQRADIFACGVIFYEMITGGLPSLFGPKGELLLGTMSRATLRCPDLPPYVDEVLAKATANEREDRYASAQEFMRALEPLSPGAATTTSGVPPADEEDLSTDVRFVSFSSSERSTERRDIVPSSSNSS